METTTIWCLPRLSLLILLWLPLGPCQAWSHISSHGIHPETHGKRGDTKLRHKKQKHHQHKQAFFPSYFCGFELYVSDESSTKHEGPTATSPATTVKEAPGKQQEYVVSITPVMNVGSSYRNCDDYDYDIDKLEEPLLSEYLANTTSSFEMYKKPNIKRMKFVHRNWGNMFRQLVDFREQYGHVMVPRIYKPNQRLASWVRRQRNEYKRMMKEQFGNVTVSRVNKISGIKGLTNYVDESQLTPQRIKSLESVGFIWDVREYIWDCKLAEVKDFMEKHGHLQLYNYGEKSLAKWLRYQQKLFKKKDKYHDISPERVAKLEAALFPVFSWGTYITVGSKRKPDPDSPSPIRYQWDDRFLQLENYFKSHGYCFMPKGPVGLRTWVTGQRTAYKRFKQNKPNILTAERIAKLEEIDFAWDSREAKWQMSFAQLEEFVKAHDLASIPAESEMEAFVTKAKSTYRFYPGTRSSLTPAKVAKFETLPGWDWQVPRDVWTIKYEQLLKFKEKYGHCAVPHSCDEYPELGRWAVWQRNQYNKYQAGMPSQMTRQRIRRLDMVGFVWHMNQEQWNTRYKELVKYKKKYGTCRISVSYENYESLLSWVSRERKAFRKMRDGLPSSMTTERFKKLDSIGFIWDHQDHAWQEKIDQLMEYREEFGDCLVPERYKNRSLGVWVTKIRREYKDMVAGEKPPSTLTPERIEQLNEMKFDWDPLETRWNEKLEELKKYKEVFGDCRVPKVSERYRQLGIWVSKQRKEYRNLKSGVAQRMTPERIAKLEGVGFEWVVQPKSRKK